MKIISIALLAVSISISTLASASILKLKTFNPGKDAIFPVTSTIVYGDHDALLVDAQFQKKYAQQLIREIKKTGKKLKYIIITHYDPDFYFGLDEMVKAFPDAKIVSTAQTAWLIAASQGAKLEVWKDKLGNDAPIKLYIPTAIEEKSIEIENNKIEIRQDKDDPTHSYLWIPSIKTILGGIAVSVGSHLWMADSQKACDIDKWIKQIKDMKSLTPNAVIPSHYTKEDTSPATLDFIIKYLEDYKDALDDNNNSSGVVADMEKKYPELLEKENLVFGAKVLKGEVPWHITNLYPAVGRKVEVHFKNTTFELNFKDDITMSFEGLSGPFKGAKDIVKYTATEVAQNIFMVYWHEPTTGSNVVHVQDWNSGIVYTNIAAKDKSFMHLKGTIKLK